jgi:predicted TIM-barrel fold metal-dependent hydrolase
MPKIDAHIHLYGDHPDTVALLAELDLKALNICVAVGDWRSTVFPGFRDLAHARPERYAWSTSFDLPDFSAGIREYPGAVVAQLEKDFAAGAVAVKVWKHIGMELRRPDGRMVLIDDELFQPIFDYLSRKGFPVIMHIGEPLACWQPVVDGRPHASYYRAHPEWHMYGRRDVPSHGELMAARDRVLARHPKLRAVGAHLAGLEHDVEEVAARLERFPNLAVDVSARLPDLLAQSSELVRDFCLTYGDRILFGTDLVSKTPHSEMSDEERETVHRSMRRAYDAYFSYFETENPVVYGGQSGRGLGLPPTTLEKLYFTNARAWYPRIEYGGPVIH